ncbi:MAG TPA: hypothetical protein VKH81_21140 [Candidatus Angelobacter sp.]|nr:hypothetical protein [Candidatus Angelobacter sp.]
MLQSCLAVLMARRGIYRRYPFFFAYTAFAVAAEITKWFLNSPSSWTYFWFAWGCEAVYVVLGFLAIFEVFNHVFEAFNHLVWFKFLLPVTGAIMLSIAILIPIVHPAVDTVPLLQGMLFLQIAVRCLQLGLFFLIFLLARFFDLDYRQYAFGIAAGFGIAAAGILLGTLARTGGGLKFLIFFQYASSVSYCVAVTVWLASFVRPEPEDPFRDFRHLFTPELFVQHLERYKQEVKGIFRP